MNMQMKSLVIFVPLVATAIAAPDARIVFQQDSNNFLPRQNVETTTTTTTESLPVVNTTTLCPENQDWCDSPTDYPEDTILKAALSQNNTIRSLFDTQRIRSRDNFEKLGEFVSDDLENICSVQTDYIMPRAARNKEGEYKYIVNHPSGAEEYVQQVRVTICSEPEQSCGHGLLGGTGLTTKCRQEYSDHKLVALSQEGEELQVETFQFPSCCTCYISQFLEY